MEMISNYLNQGLSYIVPLIILLGLLIFVHELGHFLVAKYFKVRVEVFSLGFGKKFFKFRRGDTEYCLSLIPFGGYVKMYGDDPTADIPAENRAFSFTHKPVGQRIAIVLAGPLMNFFFAIFLFAIIAFVGEDVVQPVVGDIAKSSAAYHAGLRAEDKILAVNNTPVETWNEVKELVEKNGAGSLKIQVKHSGSDTPEDIVAQTTLIANPNIISSDLQVGDLDGLTYMFKAPVVAISSSSSEAAKAGLKTGDRIVSVAGLAAVDSKEFIEEKEFARWNEFSTHILNLFELNTKKVTHLLVKYERQVDKEKFETNQTTLALAALSAPTGESPRGKAESLITALGFDYPDLYVSDVLPESAAAAAGIQKNDKIVGVDGPIDQWPSLVRRVQGYREGLAPLKISILRDGSPLELEVAPKKIKQSNPAGKDNEVYAIGVLAGVAGAEPLTMLARTTNPAKAFTKGVSDSLLWTKNTALSFLRLLQNRVSAKSIGGPIMIGQLASKTFQIGLSPFLKIMAIISINLFILNLLPVPVLDGGHLVFFTIEALRGAPLSMRKMEIAQQIGLVILMSLMVLALFNDVSRLFN